jgi:hypothetical protein
MLVTSMALTVYVPIGLPPSDPGVKLTEADASPGVAVPIAGAAGTVANDSPPAAVSLLDVLPTRTHAATAQSTGPSIAVVIVRCTTYEGKVTDPELSVFDDAFVV